MMPNPLENGQNPAKPYRFLPELDISGVFMAPNRPESREARRSFSANLGSFMAKTVPSRACARDIKRQAKRDAKETAAQLAAADRLTDARIAAQVGVCRDTITRWKREEGFAARVQEIVEEMCRQTQERWLADIEQRYGAG